MTLAVVSYIVIVYKIKSWGNSSLKLWVIYIDACVNNCDDNI